MTKKKPTKPHLTAFEIAQQDAAREKARLEAVVGMPLADYQRLKEHAQRNKRLEAELKPQLEAIEKSKQRQQLMEQVQAALGMSLHDYAALVRNAAEADEMRRMLALYERWNSGPGTDDAADEILSLLQADEPDHEAAQDWLDDHPMSPALLTRIISRASMRAKHEAKAEQTKPARQKANEAATDRWDVLREVVAANPEMDTEELIEPVRRALNQRALRVYSAETAERYIRQAKNKLAKK